MMCIKIDSNLNANCVSNKEEATRKKMESPKGDVGQGKKPSNATITSGSGSGPDIQS